MLIIMAASSVVAILPVRWFVFGVTPNWADASTCRRTRRGLWRIAAVTAALAALLWGICWLLDGTSTRTNEGEITSTHAPRHCDA
jgi:ferric-dicitrate binding protein FerR (iron transport regulator)